MSPKNPDDEAGKASGADFSSYRRQAMLDLRNCGITTEDIMSARIGISQKKVDKIKSQEAKKKEVVGRKNKYLKENSHSSFLQSSSSSLNPQVGLNSIMKKSHARVRKTLEGKPDFVMTFAVKAFGGHILKYVGDAVLAFFVVPGRKPEAKAACINAVNCAKYMLQITREAINPILNQYSCPEMNIRIGIDIGENAIIQSGWDFRPNIRKRRKNNKNNITINHNKKQQHHIVKKPVYDVLSYTISIAVKMTALAQPNHLVIGDPMYNLLDDKQRSAFQRVNMSPDIWSYVCRNSEGNIYSLYTDV